MPNWSATNYLLRGKKEDINRFCDTVNSCQERHFGIPNGFGKLWLGNIFIAFGNSPKMINKVTYNLRGLLNPDPDATASFWWGPEPSKNIPKLVPIQSGDEWVITFSTITAWERCEWLDILFDKQFPECRYAWKSTDEFGNFHKVYHPELMHAPSIVIRYHANCIEEKEFAWGEESKTAEKLTELTGMPFSTDEIKECNEAFWKKLCKFNEEHEDNEIEIEIWDLVKD